MAEIFNNTDTVLYVHHQSSPLKHTRDGSLPTKFISLKDENTGPTVKCALFGEDASKKYNEGDVVAITDAYRWKQTGMLSTKRTTQVEFRPPSTLQFEITANEKLDDPDFSDDNPDQAAEAFLVKGVISAHTYACCPKKSKE